MMSSFTKRPLPTKPFSGRSLTASYGLKQLLLPLHLRRRNLVFPVRPSSLPSAIRGKRILYMPQPQQGARKPCPYAHKYNQPGYGKDHPGIRCPIPSESDKQPPQQAGKSNSEQHGSSHHGKQFWGCSHSNVLNPHCALSNHTNREFLNKLCFKLRQGDRIGYSGPRLFRFSKNLPTVSLNPEVVTSNLAEEVRRTAGPIPPFENFQESPISLVPKKYSNKF